VLNMQIARFRYSLAAIHKTGSSFICEPPVENTDKDYVALTPAPNLTDHALLQEGWVLDGDYNRPKFQSYRLGEDNLIITKDKQFYYRFVGATYVAKLLNLTDKDERVAMFDFIMSDEPMF